MLVLFAAFDHELALIRKRVDRDTEISLKPGRIEHGHLGALELLVVRSGMGRAAMLRAADHVFRYYPVTSMMVVGYAGGTQPQLHLEDLVIPERIIDAESGDAFPIAGPLADLAVHVCGNLNLHCHRGTSVCVTSAIESPHEKAYLGTRFEANSIEMEGVVLARLAQERGIPLVMIRAIVDPLDMALPHFPDPIVARGVVRPGLLISYLLHNPMQVLQLPKLHYAATRARESVTDVCLGVCAQWNG
jgi:adenosylhomocysteine nucleosidase